MCNRARCAAFIAIAATSSNSRHAAALSDSIVAEGEPGDVSGLTNLLNDLLNEMAAINDCRGDNTLSTIAGYFQMDENLKTHVQYFDGDPSMVGFDPPNMAGLTIMYPGANNAEENCYNGVGCEALVALNLDVKTTLDINGDPCPMDNNSTMVHELAHAYNLIHGAHVNESSVPGTLGGEELNAAEIENMYPFTGRIITPWRRAALGAPAGVTEAAIRVDAPRRLPSCIPIHCGAGDAESVRS